MTTKRAVAYLRQSVGRARDDRDGGSVSIAYQLDAVQKWCGAHDTALVAWHQDVDESGAKVNRAGLDAMLRDVATIQPDAVIFWDLKRLTRNLRLFLDVFEKTELAGADMVSVTEGTRHPAFVWKLLALMAEEERDRIAVNITHGKRESTKRGRHLGYPPLGYTRDADGILQIDPATAWIVEWLYHMAMTGHTPTAICRLANERGLPTSGTVRASEAQSHDRATKSHALTKWSRQTVEQALRRPTYAGLVQSGSKSRSRYGQALGVVVAEGVHEPIIDRATWDAVQRTLDGLKQPSARKGSWHWLNGRVVCSRCGARLYYVDAGRRGKDYRDQYFRCRNSYQRTFGRPNDVCPATRTRISRALLEETVADALTRALRHVLSPARILREIEAERGAGAILARETAERELADLQKQRMRINDAIQQGIGDLPDLAKRDRLLIAAIDEALVKRDALPAPLTLPVVTMTADLCKAMGQRRERTPEQWAELCAELGLTVTVDLDAQDVRLSYASPFDAVLR